MRKRLKTAVLASAFSLAVLTAQTTVTQNGFPGLWNGAIQDPLINAACHDRAEELALVGTLSHTNDQGRTAAEQMLDRGFDAGEWAEILGAGPDWEALMAGWRSSPPHRQVLDFAGWERFGWGEVVHGTTRVAVVRFWRR